MNRDKFYVDEDAMESDLVAALRSRGADVMTVLDADLVGKDDEEQLNFAAASSCVLYTFNVSDFYRLHTQWLVAGRVHSGIPMGSQQRYSVGEQLRAGFSVCGLANR